MHSAQDGTSPATNTMVSAGLPCNLSAQLYRAHFGPARKPQFRVGSAL